MKAGRKKRIGWLGYWLLCVFMTITALGLVGAGAASGEIIIDDGDPGTSFTGTWSPSGGTSPYDGDSLWSRDGAIYTWSFDSQPAGYYEVFMWWSGSASRTTRADVAVDHEGGRTILAVDQSVNAGKWNSLGTFSFASTGSVSIRAASGSSVSTCADAVRFVEVNAPPTATITSISPNPADLGSTVEFVGQGDDPDGVVEGFEWTSDIDGFLSDSASFMTSGLSWGNHTISFRVQDNAGQWSVPVTQTVTVAHTVTIDNRDSNTSQTGTWNASSAPGFWGSESVWARDGATFSWHFNCEESAFYNVAMWHTYWASRTTSAEVTIEYSGGTSTVYVNQKENGGEWVSLGTFFFNAGMEYKVTIVASPAPASTCADAVQFMRSDDPSLRPPIAAFSSDITSTTTNTPIQFNDQSDGVVETWLWDFGDGQTSTVENPVHSYAAAGYYTVRLTVSNTYGSNTEVKEAYINVRADSENIYLVDGYSKSLVFLQRSPDYLAGLGAVDEGTRWVYTNAAKGITYYIYPVRNVAAYKAALKEEGAHIIYNGHSNFGLGATFGTSGEVNEQVINNIYYADDDKIFNYGTRFVSLKTDGMRYGQAYPNWNPVFKAGGSAIAPYDFSGGTPPYNYHIGYRMPGDPTFYRVELPNGNYVQRFPDSNVPAWFSPSGAPPDPVLNPQYFIRNTDPDWSRCEFVGNWPMMTIPGADPYGGSGYIGYNFQIHAAGTGQNTATWTVYVRAAGTYGLYANWPGDPQNATNAKYTINHGGGTTVVEVNQQATQTKYHLGSFSFGVGSYTVQLSDNANGRVVADMITLQSGNVSGILTAEFSANVTSGSAPQAVTFTDYSQVWVREGSTAITSWAWDFGDGTTSTEQNPTHTYQNAGIYNVKLTVTEAGGYQASEEKQGLIVLDSVAPLRAQFTAQNRMGSGAVAVQFKDQSTAATAWRWDFGDGTAKSYDRNPSHTYTRPGQFRVRLAVRGADGLVVEEDERAFVTVLQADEFIDNTLLEKPHFFSGGSFFGKVILDMGSPEILSSEMKYARMFYGGCNSSSYYLEPFSRGIYFFTLADEMQVSGPEYLRRYLLGDTDDQIVTRLNQIEPIWAYYNFHLKPPSMR